MTRRAPHSENDGDSASEIGGSTNVVCVRVVPIAEHASILDALAVRVGAAQLHIECGCKCSFDDATVGRWVLSRIASNDSSNVCCAAWLGDHDRKCRQPSR